MTLFADQIRKVVRSHNIAALAAAVVRPDGASEWLVEGRGAAADAKLHEHTRFQLGSVTKLFTATLLAALVVDGTVDLDDEIGRFLPAARPSAGPTPTLMSLATHTSGLPRLGRPLLWKALRHPNDPYAEVGLDDLLRTVRVRSLRPGRVRYSNVGYALLGHSLAQASGQPFERILESRVLEPFGLRDTYFSVDPKRDALHVQGHDRRGRAVDFWRFGAMGPAGGLSSSIADMARFVAIQLGHLRAGSLESAIALTHQPRVSVSESLAVGLGWHIIRGRGRERSWHNGATNGFHSTVLIDPARRAGIVILASCGLSVWRRHTADRLAESMLDAVA